MSATVLFFKPYIIPPVWFKHSLERFHFHHGGGYETSGLQGESVIRWISKTWGVNGKRVSPKQKAPFQHTTVQWIMSVSKTLVRAQGEAMHTAQFALRYPLYLWPNVDFKWSHQSAGKKWFFFPWDQAISIHLQNQFVGHGVGLALLFLPQFDIRNKRPVTQRAASRLVSAHRCSHCNSDRSSALWAWAQRWTCRGVGSNWAPAGREL